ncbi:MAG: ABC transporter ATP-binding protein [Bacteroidaceae bacterium]|nr:ABC transporter ATP-binding protein [Bacteroidaceae bacterium]
MRLNKTKYPLRQILRWLWSHHKGCRVQAVTNVVVGLLLVGLGLAGVETLRRLTDIATGAREGDILAMAGLFASILVMELLLHIASTWVAAVLGVKTQNLMQQKFFARLLNGKWSGVERFHSGDVLNRLFGDVGDIVRLMTEVLPSAVVVVVQFVASFVYLYTMDSSLALILIVVSPIFLILSRLYFMKMRRIVRKIKDSNSALQSIIQESVQHKMVIKVLERSGLMVDKLESRQKVLRGQVKSRARFSIFSKTLINVGFAGAYLTALVWGLLQLQEGLITVGVLMAFTQLINRIQRPLLDMARLLPTFVNSMTSAERLMELEELPLEQVGQARAIDGKVGIRFTDVTYSYSDNGRTVLRSFSHDFRPGTFTAILGETGAGKTTLIRLMLALIRQNSGKVCLYNEKEEFNADTTTRCNFSYVPQGNTLFSGTIRDNLLMGQPGATEEQMRRALNAAMADFVFELPDGLDTVCGEQGGGLSEGQAQRIAIARALIRPCRVLLLDEATSALDVQTEHSLLENIKREFADTTIIFVTHRLAVVGFTSDQLTMHKIIDR